MGFRKVPIIAHLYEVLESVPPSKRLPEMLVCPSAKGVLMSDSAYDRAWESWMNHLNLMDGGKNATRTNPRIQVLETFSAHQLRHKSSDLYNADVDVKTAQIRLGHANIEITLKVYTHLSEQKQIASDDAYEAMISAKYATNESNTIDAIAVNCPVSPMPAKQEIQDNVVYLNFTK